MLRRIFLLLSLAALLGAAERYDIMVQGALDSELQPLLAALEGKKEVRIDAWTYWTGRIGGQRVVIARTDMGPVNAVASTVLGIQKFHPKAIINQGTAGAHNPDLKLWDIVVGDKTTDYGAFRSTHADAGAGIQTSRWIQMRHQIRVDDKLVPFPGFAGDAKLIEAAMKIGNPRGRVVKGNVGSAFQFNKEIDYLTAMHKLFGTDSEDMESAYVAGAALGMKVPFVAVRIVSDSEYNHPEFEKIAGQYCAEFVLEMVKSLRRN